MHFTKLWDVSKMHLLVFDHSDLDRFCFSSCDGGIYLSIPAALCWQYFASAMLEDANFK